MSTTDNERFLRFWFEVSQEKIEYNCESLEQTIKASTKWYPYNKGGEFRRWYGNNELLVNWYKNGEEIKYWVTHNPKDPKTTSWGRRIFATECFFKEGLTWSSITTGNFSCRYYGKGFIFDSGANGLFVFNAKYKLYFIGLLNTKIANVALKIINPTINNGPGTVSKIPAVVKDEYLLNVNDISEENIKQAKIDWDSFETSWDFKKHPLI